MLYDDVKEICSLGLSTPIPWIILIGTYLFMVAGLIFSYGKIYKCVAKYCFYTHFYYNIRKLNILNPCDRSRRSVACQSKNMQQQQERVNIKLLKMLGVSTISYLACVLVPLIAGAIGDSDGDFIETAGKIDLCKKYSLVNFALLHRWNVFHLRPSLDWSHPQSNNLWCHEHGVQESVFQNHSLHWKLKNNMFNNNNRLDNLWQDPVCTSYMLNSLLNAMCNFMEFIWLILI